MVGRIPQALGSVLPPMTPYPRRRHCGVVGNPKGFCYVYFGSPVAVGLENNGTRNENSLAFSASLNWPPLMHDACHPLRSKWSMRMHTSIIIHIGLPAYTRKHLPNGEDKCIFPFVFP
jgi:hypothetical protein